MPLAVWIAERFLSTPSARRATGICARYELQYIISIHALREEGDTDCNCIFHIRAISIHALREEGDIRLDPERRRLQAFLSTPSARRATASSRNMRRTKLYFYPRPPRGGRLGFSGKSLFVRFNFYPRPPRGGRHLEITSEILASLFLSTPSARRATRCALTADPVPDYFYPRPPRGGRRLPHLKRSAANGFLSTPSARRATSYFQRSFRGTGISIHALREEGDGFLGQAVLSPLYFYPRPPRGGRQSRSG